MGKSGTMPRPSNTYERRQQIVDGLGRVMASRGYERATISAIAEAAGLTSGLVHYHFRSKQEVLLELAQRLAEKLTLRYQTMLRDDSPESMLEAFIDSRLATGEGSDAEAVACWVTIGTEALRQPEVGEVYRRLMRAQQAQLQEILARMPGSAASTWEAAAAILAAIEGCYQLAAAAPELCPPGFAARSVRSMARGLLELGDRG